VKRVADHLSDILETIRPLPALDVHLLDAHGCVLTEDVVAPWPLPQFDNSAMDGYAVCADDVADASEEEPVELPVVADIAAGETQVSAIRPGLSARIMTGAPMPARADSIVPVEHTDGGTARVRIMMPAKIGAHIRRAGEAPIRALRREVDGGRRHARDGANRLLDAVDAGGAAHAVDVDADMRRRSALRCSVAGQCSCRTHGVTSRFFDDSRDKGSNGWRVKGIFRVVHQSCRRPSAYPPATKKTS
jgi:hypothetical protein